MHKIYTTDGMVLAKRGAGEANSVLALLTRELGLVRASAKSARREKSKLRYGLEPLTMARFSLVKGKHEWRLIGVEKPSRLTVRYENADGAYLLQKNALGRVSKLLLRLVQGEEPTAELYETVLEGFISLASTKLTDSDSVEIILVLRILAHLGYLPHTPELSPFTSDNIFSPELAQDAARSRAVLIRAINDSLQATGL